MSNGKAMTIRLISALIKKMQDSYCSHYVKMTQHFPKPYERLDISVKLDLFNYVTKADLRGATGVDASSLTAKSDLARLEVKVNKIDVYKLKTVLADLSKLSNVVNNGVVNKTKYDKLVTKVHGNDNGLLLKTQYGTDRSGLEKNIHDADKKMLHISGLV